MSMVPEGAVGMLVIDRIEGEWVVVCQGQMTFKIPMALMPEGIQENDVVDITVTKNERAAKARKEKLELLANDVFED